MWARMQRQRGLSLVPSRVRPLARGLPSSLSKQIYPWNPVEVDNQLVARSIWHLDSKIYIFVVPGLLRSSEWTSETRP